MKNAYSITAAALALLIGGGLSAQSLSSSANAATAKAKRSAHAHSTYVQSGPRGSNDECAGASTLTVGASCTPVNDDWGGATESMAPITCNGYTNDIAMDLWYKFVATTTTTIVEVTGGPETDPVVEVFDGSCGSLTSIGCADATLINETEDVSVTTVVGTTYYYRTYWWNYGTPPVDFSLTTCVYEGAAPAGNDDCSGTTPHSLSIGSNVTMTGDNAGGTDNEGLGFSSVWEQFTLTDCADVTINYCGTDPVYGNVIIVLFSDCPPATVVWSGSYDFTGCPDGNVSLCYAGLDPGTYYIPIIYQAGVSEGPYTINVAAQSCGSLAASNDECPGAWAIPVSTFCNPIEGNNLCSSESMPALECNASTGNANDDVWYSFVPTQADMTIGLTPSGSFDAVIEVFEGSCGSLTSIGCADNTVGLEPEQLELTGLTVGATYYIRVYNWAGQTPTDSPYYWICAVEGTGVNIGIEENATLDFSVFPNPGNGDFTIQMGDDAGMTTVELIDLRGRVAFTEVVNLAAGQQHEMHLNGQLAQGSYTLRLTSEKGTSEQSVMVR